MSGVAVVRYLLANNANLIAVVTAANIKAGAIPLGTVLPAISVQEISSTRYRSIEMPTTGPRTERVQITVMATSYAQQKSILGLVILALPNQRGTVNSVVVNHIVPDSEGPDFEDTEATIYMQSIDYMVRWSN